MQQYPGAPGSGGGPGYAPTGYGPAITPAGLGARFGAYLLEALLVVVTLGIGWLIWSFVVWGKGTTPAKQMCGLVCVDARTGHIARGGQMANRELVGKWLLGSISCGATGLVSVFMILFGREHRGVWDSVANTIVVRADLHFAGVGGTSPSRAAAVSSRAAPPPPGGAAGGAVAVPSPPPTRTSGPYSTPSAPLSSQTGGPAVVPPPPSQAPGPYSTPAVAPQPPAASTSPGSHSSPASAVATGATSRPAAPSHSPTAPSSAPALSPSTTMRRDAVVPATPVTPAAPAAPAPTSVWSPSGGAAASVAPVQPAAPDDSHSNARLSPIIGFRGPLSTARPAATATPAGAPAPVTTVPAVPQRQPGGAAAVTVSPPDVVPSSGPTSAAITAAPVTPGSFGAAPAVDTGTVGRTVQRGVSGGWQLVFDDGRRVAVVGTVLFGRDPAPLPRFAAGQPIALADASMQLSKTHTAVGSDGDVLWVEDCNSTNGTAIRAIDGNLQDIVGRRVLNAGDCVVLGGQSFIVERVP